MIYQVAPGKFFASLPSRTSIQHQEWGLFFTEDECFPTMMQNSWREAAPASLSELDSAKTFLLLFSKKITELTEHLEELFAFQSKKDDRTFVLSAVPRVKRTFVAKKPDPEISELFIELHPLDRHFIRVENLLSGEQEVWIQSQAFRQGTEQVGTRLSAHLSTILVMNEKLQSILDIIRDHRIKNAQS